MGGPSYLCQASRFIIHPCRGDVLDNPPPSFKDLETLPIAQTKVVDLAGIDQAVKDLF